MEVPEAKDHNRPQMDDGTKLQIRDKISAVVVLTMVIIMAYTDMMPNGL